MWKEIDYTENSNDLLVPNITYKINPAEIDSIEAPQQSHQLASYLPNVDEKRISKEVVSCAATLPGCDLAKPSAPGSIAGPGPSTRSKNTCVMH